MKELSFSFNQLMLWYKQEAKQERRQTAPVSHPPHPTPPLTPSPPRMKDALVKVTWINVDVEGRGVISLLSESRNKRVQQFYGHWGEGEGEGKGLEVEEYWGNLSKSALEISPSAPH